MNHTFGYILCCQSPALFLLAAALLIMFFIRRSKNRFRAAIDLIGCIVCIGLGIVLYYEGIFYEHFTIKNFWQLRGPGWIGLALTALFLLFLLLNAMKHAAVRRSAEKDANRAENLRQKELEDAKNAAYAAGRADALQSAQQFNEPVIPHSSVEIDPPEPPAAAESAKL